MASRIGDRLCGLAPLLRLFRFPAVTLVVFGILSVDGLLSASPDRRFPKNEYATPLEKEMIEASFHGKIDTVKWCIAKGARVDARYGGDSVYFTGADGGIPVSGFNWTALMAATENNQFAVVEFLISKDASVKLDDGWGATPLSMLAEKRRAIEGADRVAAIFIKKGANVNAKVDVYIDGPSGTTALHDAVAWGHVELVKMLVAAGADVHAKTSTGEVPLDCVCEGRNDKAIRRILMDAGGRSAKR